MATIYEVAKEASVSPATVSRVLNGIRVRDDMAVRVLEASKRLGYSPNRTARNLRMQSSEIIVLIVPDIENPYFTSLARGVEDRAREAGYSVILCNSDEDVAKEADYLRIALTQQTAGVIIAHASAETDIGPLLTHKRLVVAVDRAPGSGDVDEVAVDNVAAGEIATRALLRNGYRRIACITGPANVETARDRAEGWRTIAGDRADELVHADYRFAGGQQAMLAILDHGVADAVVVANNVMGAGTLAALQARGLQPKDFGIAVIGGLPFAPLWLGGVHVVELPARELGLVAARTLIERIAGLNDAPKRIILPIPELDQP